VQTATLVPRAGYEDTFTVDMRWGDPIQLPIETDGGSVEAGEVAISYLGRILHDGASSLDDVDAALDELLRR
jgi:hypothetical protein